MINLPTIKVVRVPNHSMTSEEPQGKLPYRTRIVAGMTELGLIIYSLLSALGITEELTGSSTIHIIILWI